MARFSQYDNYLPGEIYSSGLDSLREDPQLVVDYLSNKKFKFDPADNGNSFQRFLTLQNDPESLVRNKMRTPQQFQLFNQLSNLGT